MARQPGSEKLKKSLTLFDVYAIATGAMFSAEFFLLPGIALSYTGPSVVLAYLISGILVLPAMFSQAELSTAMPKAGGTYYFIDRSLGPMVGTVGGIGTWFSLIFKSAFALIGIGAYLVLFVELPIKPVAIALTIAFTLLNIVGAKETGGLQRLLVTTLIGILTLFILQGLIALFPGGTAAEMEGQLSPFLPFGVGGLLSAIGLVFAAYTGLTKVASVAEEVENPDRNIPLAMMLSLGTAIFVYVVGVFLLVVFLDPAALQEDLTPFATAADRLMGWLPTPGGLPESTGVLLIVIAALSAFASTGNAGILSASRYPLAMARDRLITRRFDKISRFDTPMRSILVTGAAMVFFILTLDVEGVAKLASAFNLLVFGLINLAVIVMRESHIPSYAPGFRSPLYPWMQIIGILTSVVLIIQIGTLSIVFTLGIIAASIGWYFYYARNNPDVEREGAIYHLFERLGRHRDEDLEGELHGILKEKGLTRDAPFEQLVARADVIDLEEPVAYENIVQWAAERLSARLDTSAETLERGFREGTIHGQLPVSHGAALPHYRLPHIERAELALVRCRSGICIQFGDEIEGEWEESEEPVYAFFFLVSPEDKPSEHLRILAQIARRVDDDDFLTDWRQADDEQKLKEVLLHYERFMSLSLLSGADTEELIDRPVRDLSLPAGNLIALIRREGEIIVPNGSTVLREGDRLTIIGDPAGLKRLRDLYSDRQE